MPPPNRQLTNREKPTRVTTSASNKAKSRVEGTRRKTDISQNNPLSLSTRCHVGMGKFFGGTASVHGTVPGPRHRYFPLLLLAAILVPMARIPRRPRPRRLPKSAHPNQRLLLALPTFHLPFSPSLLCQTIKPTTIPVVSFSPAAACYPPSPALQTPHSATLQTHHTTHDHGPCCEPRGSGHVGVSDDPRGDDKRHLHDCDSGVGASAGHISGTSRPPSRPPSTHPPLPCSPRGQRRHQRSRGTRTARRGSRARRWCWRGGR